MLKYLIKIVDHKLRKLQTWLSFFPWVPVVLEPTLDLCCLSDPFCFGQKAFCCWPLIPIDEGEFDDEEAPDETVHDEGPPFPPLSRFFPLRFGIFPTGKFVSERG